MKEPNSLLGELLKIRRDEAGLGISEVAEKLDLDRKQIYRYEAGEQYPDIDRLKTMSDLYKCDLFGDISKLYGFPSIENKSRKEVIEQFLESIQGKIEEVKKVISTWSTNSDDPRKKFQQSLQKGRGRTRIEHDQVRTSADKSKAPNRPRGRGNNGAKGK